MKKLLLSGLALFCVSCGAGSNINGTPTISAVQSSGSGTCGSGISNACVITLTYNTANNASLSFSTICSNVVGGSSSTSCLGAYSFNFTNCPVNNTNVQQSCNVPVSYTGTASPKPSENVAFTIGTSAQSTSITLGVGNN